MYWIVLAFVGGAAAALGYVRSAKWLSEKQVLVSSWIRRPQFHRARRD
jgi:hypothetical protein